MRGEPGGHAPLAIREPALACMGHEPTIEPALALLSAAVLRTATARHERNVAASALGPVDGDGATAAILNAAGWRSFICVPMLVRGKPLGTITVAIVTSARSYESGDLQVVEDLGRRIALAVDNARLFSAAQESRHEAEIANHAKDEFLAVLSHELRTPLNAMIGWVHLLRRGTLDEPTFRRAIESIKTSADSQAKLIDDLTDVSRIISGKVRLNMRVLDPAPVIEAAVTAIGPTAEAKNITIVRSLDRGKAAVRADADRLQQVVWNLVSNAVKFTPEGGRVHVRFRRDGGKIEIVVSDTGKGIQRSFLPLVFDPFRQADSTTTRRHGGLGLGLAIVRNLVELHGGTVRADSPGEDQGATFTVTLPITSVPVAVPAARRPEDLVPAHEPALRNLRILVVDDELSARELLAMILEHSGAKVQLAASAQEALDLFTSFRPNVLISDIGMPDEDGYSLMRKITKLSQRGPVVPSVALTAYARTEDRLQALAAGFHVHMAKPVEPAELLAVIASLVTRPTCAIEQE
ncbi:MAG: ATP-binding protein [Planctomycetota bacterium]